MTNRWEQIWDDVWQTGASGSVITNLREYYSSLLKRVVSANLTKQSKVLELGSGTGTLLLSLAKEIGEGVGLDISGEALFLANRNKAKQASSNISFHKGDCTAVSYEDYFDVVYSAGLIEHFFADDIKVVEQHLKAAKPGGRVVMSVPYAYSLHSLHYALTRPKLTRKYWPWSNERYFQKWYSLKDLNELGAKTGQPFKVHFLKPAPIGLGLGIAVLELRKEF